MAEERCLEVHPDVGAECKLPEGHDGQHVAVESVFEKVEWGDDE